MILLGLFTAVVLGAVASFCAWNLFFGRKPQYPLRKLAPAALRVAPAAALGWSVCLALVRGPLILWAAACLFPLAAWLAPMFLARSRARERKTRLRRELPTLLDSLVLRTEAGMPLTAALIGSREVFPPDSPIADEIGFFRRDLDLGRTAVEALESMRRRMQKTGAEAPLGALIRGIELGTPVQTILGEQSERVRQSLLTEAEKFANTLSIRLLIPLLLFIFPASFLVILSPVIVFLLGEKPW